MGMPIIVERDKYKYLIFAAEPPNTNDDNFDVEIHANEKRYFGTFFTLQNVDTLMSKWEKEGDANHGQYFNAADMIIVRELTTELIDELIAYMYKTMSLKVLFHGCG